MRQLVMLCALPLAACGAGERDRTEAFNQHMAEANALLAPEMPRGWHYSVRPDRIRDKVDYLASLPNEDEGRRDQTMILVIQKLSEEDIAVFLRGHNNAVGCAAVCGIAYRADNETGSWTGERTYTGNEVMLHDPKAALATIRASREMIIEVPSDLTGQYTFNVAGLVWPPTASSP